MRKYSEEFCSLIDVYSKNPEVKSMKNYIQHGKISTYEHCVYVAWISFQFNRKLKIKANEKELVEAAMLHDFYLYDWHNNPCIRLHGFSHAACAAENAKKKFNVSKNVYEAIDSHMWPLNITRIPRSRIAWVICLSDKYCALKETLFYRKEKKYD